jgi:hypothetical protein
VAARGVHRNHILAVTTVFVGGCAWWGLIILDEMRCSFHVRWVHGVDNHGQYVLPLLLQKAAGRQHGWQGHLAANADADDDGRAGRVAS